MVLNPNQLVVIPRSISWFSTIIISGVAMILGGGIYIGWRPDPPLFISWLKDFGLADWVSVFRYVLQNKLFDIPDWLIYSVPNALWAFAYSNLICHLWHQRRGWERILWVSTAPLLPIIWESAQYLEVVPGIFCWVDLFLGLLGAGAGISMFTKKILGS